jgi:hypothetical protein
VAHELCRLLLLGFMTRGERSTDEELDEHGLRESQDEKKQRAKPARRGAR